MKYVSEPSILAAAWRGSFLGIYAHKGHFYTGREWGEGTGMLSELVCLFNPPPLVWRGESGRLGSSLSISLSVSGSCTKSGTSPMCTTANSFIQYFENLSVPASTSGNRVCLSCNYVSFYSHLLIAILLCPA